jgi:hypothetical protein
MTVQTKVRKKKLLVEMKSANLSPRFPKATIKMCFILGERLLLGQFPIFINSLHC